MNKDDYTKTTQYGFLYGLTEKGLANVARLHSDDKYGTLICIETTRQSINIRITSGGKIIPFNVEKKEKKEFWHLSHQDRLELEATDETKMGDKQCI